MSVPRCPSCGATYGEGLVDDNMAEWCDRCGYSWHAEQGYLNRGGDRQQIAEYDRKRKEELAKQES